MRKSIVVIWLLVLIVLAAGCTANKEYRLVMPEDSRIVGELKESYSAGEEVVIKLRTWTEHYYILYINGQELPQSDSNMQYTYFVFTMPSEDVVVTIEDVDMEIPTA